MHWIVCPDEKSQAKACASIIAAQVLQKPSSVLGFATGSSPLKTYAELIEMSRQGAVSFSRVRTFNLDEYAGLPRDHPQSYSRFMWDNLFSGMNMREDQARIPNGMAADLDAECRDYEQAIEDAGGIDLQLLGIGHDGHIAFNEPGPDFSKFTHVERLNARTVEANKRFFDSADDVPRTALSMGVGSIMRARRILLAASGKDKAEIVKEAFLGPVTPSLTASILQFHGDCTIILDREAASALTYN
ncbi:MAG: glucosamine-6-phosphate deaminase [Oscillospiraceae bacterium]|jgi:glucosamine-6-phosphate deaminase|nr:glucosamine-6-phosphate deaminase [Oscillospiraceae bacterium]